MQRFECEGVFENSDISLNDLHGRNENTFLQRIKRLKDLNRQSNEPRRRFDRLVRSYKVRAYSSNKSTWRGPSKSWKTGK